MGTPRGDGPSADDSRTGFSAALLTEAHLAEAAMALLGCRSEDEVYDVIGAFMLLLSERGVIIVNETSADAEWLITRRMFGVDALLDSKVVSVIGFDPVGHRAAIAVSHREELLSGVLSKVPGGFVELASFEVPRIVAQAAARVFSLYDAYSIGIADGANVLGNIQIYTRTPGEVVPTYLVETFARHCYSALASIRSARQLVESSERIESLLGSRRLLQLFFDRNPDGVVIIDTLTACPVHFNETAHAQLGYSRDEFASLCIADIEEGATPESVRARIDEVMRHGRADYETVHRTKAGESRRIFETSQRIDTADQPMYFSVWRDITDQRNAEDASREQSERVDLLLDSTVEGIHGFDLDGRVTFCNAASHHMLGYESPQDVLGRGGHELYHHHREDGSTYCIEDCPVSRSLTSGESAHIDDEVFWRADGTSFPVEYWVRPVREDDQVVGTVISFIDVSDREQARDEIADALEFNETIIEASPIGIAVLDASLSIVLANEAAASIAGTTVAEFVGSNAARMEFWRASGLAAAASKVLIEHVHEELEFRGATFYGVERCLSLRLSPFQKGGESHVLVMLTDVTKRAQAEEAVRLGKVRLEGVLKSITETMGKVVEARDPYTQGHERGVAIIARRIGEEMGLPPDEVDGIEVAALVHDVGKLSVPAEILTKPGDLLDIERRLMEEHSRVGSEILKDIDFDWPVSQIVLQHHERMDGSGYPDGIAGDEILPAARVIMAADLLDAMTSHRPYRAACSVEEAMTELTDHPGSFDPEVVAACQRLCAAGMIRP